MDFWGPFSLERQEEKIHPKTHGRIHTRILGVLFPKSTLQGSGLDDFSLAIRGFGAFELTVPKYFYYASPIGAFFCSEIRAFTGFGARVLQPAPKSLVTIKHNSNTKMAVNSR